DSKRVDEARRVGGHVVEGVGRDRIPARKPFRHHGRQVRRAELRQMGRTPDIAVVKPDDAEPLYRKSLIKRVRPKRQRSRKPHDKQNDRIAVASDALVFDVDAVGVDARHEREPQSLLSETITETLGTARRAVREGTDLERRSIRDADFSVRIYRFQSEFPGRKRPEISFQILPFLAWTAFPGPP